MNKTNHFQKTHAVNSWLNLILSAMLVIFVFACIVMNLLADPTELVQEVGLKTFRMYTVLSNIFVGITASMSIPFAVDGIRDQNYHLPRWIVNLTLVSTSCITLTFLISLCVLSPQAGFIRMMATRSNLFLHTIVPLTAIILFLFVNHSHTVKFKTSLLAMVPVFAYAVVYVISAIAIGEENGGWRDHYHFQELMPWYYLFVLMLLLVFGISTGLRLVHNYMHRRDKLADEWYYQNAPEYALPTIEEAIRSVARDQKKKDTGGEVVVPRRIIRFLEKKYNSQKPLADLCKVYLEEFLK